MSTSFVTFVTTSQHCCRAKLFIYALDVILIPTGLTNSALSLRDIPRWWSILIVSFFCLDRGSPGNLETASHPNSTQKPPCIKSQCSCKLDDSVLLFNAFTCSEPLTDILLWDSPSYFARNTSKRDSDKISKTILLLVSVT